jgi:hypothetical protein
LARSKKLEKKKTAANHQRGAWQIMAAKLSARSSNQNGGAASAESLLA